MGEYDFRKSFSPKPVCLAITENEIFRKITSCWPKFTPLTRKWFYTLIFTSNHFRVTQKREREREKERKTQREREKERELRSSQRARERTRAPIQPPTPIYLTPVTPSSARRSPRQTPQTHGEWELKLTPIQPNALDPTQPVDHGPATPITEPNTDSRWVFLNRFTVHTITSPPTHTRLIHTLTSPLIHSPHRSNPSSRSDLCIIYIYLFIYLYIYLYKYLYNYLLFLFINFFNYPFFIKLCIYGLCIWNFGAFLIAGYSGLVCGLIFF